MYTSATTAAPVAVAGAARTAPTTPTARARANPVNPMTRLCDTLDLLPTSGMASAAGYGWGFALKALGVVVAGPTFTSR